MPGRGSRQRNQERFDLRCRLEREGVPATEIDRQVAALRAKQDAAIRQKEERRRATVNAYLHGLEDETYARLSLDDSGYRPSSHDPLRTGPARATGMTARAVGRTNAMTRWQHDAEQRRA